MDSLFHNRSVAQIAGMAFEAQQRMLAAKAELDACKLRLIEIAEGGKLQVNVPQICRVTVNEVSKDPEKREYIVDSEKFDGLDLMTRQMLLDGSVIKERIRTQPRLPVVRISAA